MLRLGIIEEKNGNSATKLLATSFSNKFLNKIYIRFVETSFLFSHQKRKDQIYLQLPSSRGPLGNYFPKPHSKQSSFTFIKIKQSFLVDQGKQGEAERKAKQVPSCYKLRTLKISCLKPNFQEVLENYYKNTPSSLFLEALNFIRITNHPWLIIVLA